MFKDMLKSDETLFKNAVALDYDFIPKMIPYRETQQQYIASCIKPLFQNRNGKNVLVYGPPGVGKSVAIKHILQELEEETEDIVPVYINCWQKNTSYKIIIEVCEALDYRLTHNKKTDELLKIIKTLLNKKAVVFVFDEIDKVEDFDFLYSLLEDIYRKTIILITNYQEEFMKMDDRIKSRLIPEMLEFKPYNIKEISGIIKERVNFAFIDKVWEEPALNEVSKKTFEAKDVRIGLYLLRESGNIAEERSSKKITSEHVNIAVSKIGDFSTKNKDELDEDLQKILELVKANPSTKIGDLFKMYQENGGQAVYKTFQRKIAKLAENKFITTKKITGGAEGSTTIIEFEKKLTDF